VLLENLLRTEDGANITADDIRAIAEWDSAAEPDTEIQFTPARVIMQDFTGVPCVVDLATMREAMADLGGDPTRSTRSRPAELVIDHSVIADVFGRADAFERNVDIEYERNLRALPVPAVGTGRLRRLQGGTARHRHRASRSTSSTSRAWVVRETDDGQLAYPDTCVGTDSHTTMVNGLAWSAGESAASRPRPPCSASR
jgi:aconitate hydratase